MAQKKRVAYLSLMFAGIVSLAAAQPPVRFYAVTDYGALCNGQSDDTAGIQAAINAAFPGGTVVLPATRCVISQTLVFGDTTSAQRTSFISLEGSNPESSQLAWKGPSSGAAIRLVRNKYFTFQRMGLLNMTGARGTLAGIELGGYGTAGGTETLQGDFRHVTVSGFNVNIQAGANGAASSEIRYDHVKLSSANICWQNENFNTLNHVFTMLGLSSCGVGVRQWVGNISVRGGATDHNGIDFLLDGDQAIIEGMRSELDSGGTFVNVHILNGAFRMAGNIVTGNRGIALDANVMRYATIEDNVLWSPIIVRDYVLPGALVLENNHVWSDGDTPVSYMRYGGGRFRFYGNANARTWQAFPDVTGAR